MTTLLDIKNHVKSDLDLFDEDWVDDADITRWTNEGIKAAEAEIHTLYEDYFLVQADPIAITRGDNLVDYPSDIYGNKIRKVYFREELTSSTSNHIVRRYTGDLTKLINREIDNNDSTDPILQWIPINTASDGRKIRLSPEQGRTGYIIIWYIRNAAQLSADTDVLDIDEFQNFVIQYVKTQAYLKDGDIRADDSKVLQEQYKQDMINTLSDMTPNQENELDMDFSFYRDHVGIGYDHGDGGYNGF